MYSFSKIALGVATAFACSLGLTAQVKVFDGQPETRNLSRLFYYTTEGGFTPKGQVFMNHGVPTWQEGHAEKLEQMLAADAAKPMRWRFGAGAWTTLDTNVGLKLGGVEIPAGHYYAALELSSDKKLRMVLLDPAKIRAKKMDAFQAAQTTGGIIVPLEWTKSEDSVEKFSIALLADKKEPAKFSMTVRWANHVLKVSGTAKLD